MSPPVPGYSVFMALGDSQVKTNSARVANSHKHWILRLTGVPARFENVFGDVLFGFLSIITIIFRICIIRFITAHSYGSRKHCNINQLCILSNLSRFLSGYTMHHNN